MSDDPTLVDTATLLKSMRSDIAIARGMLVDAWRFLEAANATAWELESRHHRAAQAPAATTLPANPSQGPDKPP
jgi:hypothetical protein